MAGSWALAAEGDAAADHVARAEGSGVFARKRHSGGCRSVLHEQAAIISVVADGTGLPARLRDPVPSARVVSCQTQKAHLKWCSSGRQVWKTRACGAQVTFWRHADADDILLSTVGHPHLEVVRTSL